MTDIIEQAAKVMFESSYGYHEDLNWDNAYEKHRELYRKYARLVQPIFHDYYTTGDYTDDIGPINPDVSWVKFTKVGRKDEPLT